MNDIDLTRSEARSPRIDGICERFHTTILNEFHLIAFRKKLHAAMEELRYYY